MDAKAEFLSGAVVAGHQLERVAGFLEGFPVVWPGDNLLLCYAQCYADLRRGKRHVGPNDLWIAAAALARHLPLLTRNARELARIEGLQVIDDAGA